ncbi:hypothetical protein [Saccharothrix sp.]|nr:hypothetical protein [Saccharothrix sp.]
MPRNLVTDADRARVRELHAEGKTRNDIARAIGPLVVDRDRHRP